MSNKKELEAAIEKSNQTIDSWSEAGVIKVFKTLHPDNKERLTVPQMRKKLKEEDNMFTKSFYK